MTPETKLKNKFKHLLKTANPDIMIISLSERYQSGLPDIMTISQGHVAFYELKSTMGRVTLAQRIQMKRLSQAGAPCFIVKGTPFKFDIIPIEVYEQQLILKQEIKKEKLGRKNETNRKNEEVG